MSTLFVEAFGKLSDSPTIDSQEEDLYSVFRARSELMGCSTNSSDRPLPWSQEEAEITADTDPCRIGWVQVGLGVGPVEMPSTLTNPTPGWASSPIRQKSTEPAVALPALIQCFYDALRRFGVVELSGLQVTASNMGPDSQSRNGYLVSVLNWFNTDLKGRAEAIVAFDQGLLGEHEVSELVAILQWRNTETFEFGPVVAIPERHFVKAGSEWPIHSISPASSGLGISVMLPEWSRSAAGWALASVIDAARLIETDATNFTVRLTRVR